MQETILFTGGGTAGHVTPNLALIEYFQNKNWKVLYIGSENGIEKEIITRIHIPYYSIATDKLRRHFTWRNLLTPFKVIEGMLSAIILCRKLKPTVVFSKGGFVAFPVVFGAWVNRIPVIIHESDLTPGLANRLSFPFAKKICVTFPEGVDFFKNKNKVIVTGTPIRPALLQGNAVQGRKFCGFNQDKSILLIIGGSSGAEKINQAIRHILPQLLERFQIIHLCGKNKVDPSLKHLAGYQQFEYLHDELADVFACADVIVSRAGANSLYELLALNKPHLLIPLSTQASRGDQISNAKYFAAKGLSQVIFEKDLTDEKLLADLLEIERQKNIIRQKLADYKLPESVNIITKLVLGEPQVQPPQ